MHNNLFTIGPVTIHGYGLMIAIGVFSAYLTAEYRAKKMGLDYERIFNLTIWAALGGILGAKLLYYITTIPEIIKNPRLLLDVANGFVVYGGIIGGTISGYVFCKRNKWDFLQTLDLTLPSIALAQGFGRIGCFLAGCCYGEQTNSKFAITFHNSAYAPNNIPLIPTQILSSAFDFLNFFVLILLAKNNKVKGKIGACYLMFYSIGRFIIEFFRGDLERGFIGVLSTSQFISILIFIFGAVLFVVRVRITKKEVQELDDLEIESADESEVSLSLDNDSDDDGNDIEQ